MLKYLIHVCLLLLLLILIINNTNCNDSPIAVWLTVSAKANRTVQRNIEIHWRNAAKSDANDWVGIFSIDPVNNFMETAIETVPVLSRDKASHVTKVQFPYRQFTSNLTEQCLGYYVAYISNNSALAKNCIKTNPFWMEKSLSLIGDRTLPSIMIPGTHNSGSFEKWTKNSYYNLLKRFYVTHDESIYNQLVYGIRYLDMRVGYYESQEVKLWIVHDLIRTNLTLKTAVQEVKQFLLAAPKEIVILDFHRFVEGFQLNDKTNASVLRKRFDEFQRIITSELAEHMINVNLGYGVKIRQLIELDKRLLVGFPSENVKYLSHSLAQYLWPKIRHQWANTDRLDRLVRFFDNNLCADNRQILRSAMAELTPTRWGVFRLNYSGLRALANTTNGHMTEWFGDRWSQCANIVAVDFFMSSNIVDIAINANNKT